MLIQQYVFIDRLLDSSLPHDLIQEYQYRQQAETAVNIPTTITEELGSGLTPPAGSSASLNSAFGIGSPDGIPNGATTPKIKRTPKNLYKIPDESTPLMRHDEEDEEHEALRNDSSDKMPQWEPEEETDLSDRIVTIAIYINFAANAILLVLKIIVTVMTSSVSVLAALVDAILDFLSTAIVWGTTRLISTSDDYGYPVGRRRLEPIGVLVFSVIMITSFFQVGLEGFSRLNSSDHMPIELGYAAIAIMATTVVIKGLCWFWCRLIKNSGVQALAQDAATDVVFNTFSIIFPLGKSLLLPSLWITANKMISRLLRQHLVPRPPRRYPPLNLRNPRLVPHNSHPHQKPLRGRRLRRRAEHPPVPNHALRQVDQANPGTSGLPRR